MFALRRVLQAWTNMRDRKNARPGFRAVRLKYSGPAAGCRGLLYTGTSAPVWVGDHSLKYRAREKFRQNWTWTDAAKVQVVLPADPLVRHIILVNMCAFPITDSIFIC